jgi:hypothetical protein
MAQDIDGLLAAWKADDYTARLVRGICGVVPFAPEVNHFGSVAELLKTRDARAKKPTLDRALELAKADEAQRALWIVNAMDTADGGITVFTGLSTAVNLYRSKSGERLAALETDQQQAADAVLKGLALAYLVWKLFPGSPTEKVAAFRALPSGQALAFYYAVIEVGLPFADNALVGGGSMLADLYGRLGGDQTKKFAAVAGEDAAAGAATVMDQLVKPVDGLVQMASSHLSAIATTASGYLPGAMDVGDKAAGMVATAADAMPVYRYLGARVVAEACVQRALLDVPPDGPVAGSAAAKNPMLDEVKYTTKKAGKDEIIVPATPARRGCFLFGVALIVATGAALATWGLA